MNETWFAILVFMLTVFALLDGWNIGAGIVHHLVGRDDAQRRTVVAALGPYWSWHEVWLIAFGGVLFVAFPVALATALPGFYLAVMMLLWSLVLRGMALEIGGHLKDPLWRSFWDGVFTLGSTLLALLIGVGLGNLVRGVPLAKAGEGFWMPLFTDFTGYGQVGLLDWYTVLTGGFTVAALGAHGASYLALKTTGPVNRQATIVTRRLWLLTAVLLVAVTAGTVLLRPELFSGMLANPVAWAGAVVLLGGGGALLFGLLTGHEPPTFLGGCALIAGLFICGGAGTYPVMLHSTLDPAASLTAAQAAVNTSPGTALVWWPLSLVLVVVYFTIFMRVYAGKVGTGGNGGGYGSEHG